MIKVIVKYLLSATVLLFLFVGGYSHLPAQSYNKEGAFHSPVKNFESLEHANISTGRGGDVHLDTPASFESRTFHRLRLVFEKEEDDKFLAFRKHLENLHHSTSLFFTQILGSFCGYSKIAVPFCRHLSHTPSCQYLILRVFRI